MSAIYSESLKHKLEEKCRRNPELGAIFGTLYARDSSHARELELRNGWMSSRR